jgi:predicted kinase
MFTLYTLTGLPYSGKSTLRKELVKRFGFNLVSTDEIMDEKNMWREGHPTQEDWNLAYSEAYETLKKYLRLGMNVVFDGGSLKFRERETQRKIAKECNARHKLIYINTTREEILKRQLKNEETKERGQLTKEEMDTAFGMFEEPTEAENPIIYNHKMDLDEWMRENIR